MNLSKLLMLLLLVSQAGYGQHISPLEPHVKVIEATGSGCRKITINETGTNLRPYLNVNDQKVYLYDLGISNYGVFHYCYSSDENAELVLSNYDDYHPPNILSDLIAEAEILYSEAIINLNNKQPEGVEYAQKSGYLFIELGKTERAAEAFTLAAKIAAREKNTEVASIWYQQAANVWSNTENIRMQAIAYNDWGRSFHYQGLYQEEMVRLKEALTLAFKIDDSWLIAVIKNNICLNFHESGQFNEVFDCYQEVLELSKSVKDNKRIAKTLNNMGGYHADLGNSKESVGWFREAINYYQLASDEGGAAIAQANIGNQLILQGKYQKAISVLHQSRNVLREFAESNKRHARFYQQEYGWAEFLIGSAFFKAGDIDTAKQFLINAIVLLSDEIGKPLNMKNWLSANSTLFDIYQLENKQDKALRLFASIEDSIMDTNEILFQIKYLLKLGDLYYIQKDWKKSLATNKMARTLADSTDNPYLIALTKASLGMSYLDFDRQKAVKYLIEANEFISTVNPKKSVELQIELARAEYEEKNYLKSHTHLKEATDLIDSIGVEINDHNLRVSVFSSWRKLVDLETKLYLSSDEQMTSIDVERAYLANTRFNRVPLNSLSNIKNNFELHAINEKIKTKLNLRLQLLEERNVSNQIQTIENDIERLSAQVKSMMIVNAENDRFYLRNYTFKDVLDRIDSNETLLRFWFSDVESYVWVISKKTLKLIKLPDKSHLLPAINSAMNMLKRPGNKNIKLKLNDISELIKVKEWVQYLKTEHILVESGGGLSNFPIDILPLSKEGSRFILDDFSFVYIRSIFFQDVNHLDKQLTIKKISILADPVTSINDNRLVKKPVKEKYVNDEFKVFEENHKLSLPVSLSRLPGTKFEAEAINELLGSHKMNIYLGFEATKQNFLKQSQKASILHLATHSYNDFDSPMLSGLVMSRFDKQGNVLDATIRYEDIVGLNMKSDLVVLSACETAFGKQVSIHGILGLPRAFLESGAKQVVFSLWPISDRATTSFMERFYFHLKNSTQSPGHALALVKRELKDDRRFSDIYYWGGVNINL